MTCFPNNALKYTIMYYVLLLILYEIIVRLYNGLSLPCWGFFVGTSSGFKPKKASLHSDRKSKLVIADLEVKATWIDMLLSSVV